VWTRGDSLIGARRVKMQKFNARQNGTIPLAGPNSIIAPNQQRPVNFEVVPLP
jgi:hypothetical protein